MNRFESITKPLMWFMALLLAGLVAGCGNGDPILGGGGNGIAVPLDTTRPRVAVTLPANAGSVAANAKITATFTEAMAPATITGGTTVTLKETTGGANVPLLAVNYTVSSKTVDFKPTVDLNTAKNYTATITTAATDLAGNALAGNQAALPAASNYVWSFNVVAADTTRPKIILEYPANAASGVAANSPITAKFDKAMDPSSLSSTTFTVSASGVPAVVLAGAYTYDLLTNISTFTPSSNLQANTDYVATIIGATDLSGNSLDQFAGLPDPWTFRTANAGLAPGAVPLGSAATFGLMATAAITSAGPSVINGDVSLEPGTSMTGFPPAIVNGAIHINDTVSHQARNDLLAAYNYAKGLAPGTTISAGADLGSGGLYPAGIPPGTYTSGSTMLVSTPLVLDAGGNANAVWVFQIGSSFTTAANVTLANGAQSKNVFWVPTSDGTIGVGTTFEGTIVAGRDVTSAGGATINGRILAGAITAGTIALNGGASTVNVPAP